jgi:hypothetical protein
MRLQHLVELIASGHGTPTVVKSLHREEARKEGLVAELAQLEALTTTLSLNERQITKQLQSALGNHPALLGRHVPLARQMLRTLLDGNIICEPIDEDHSPGYRFTATGTFGRLLAGTSVRLRVKRIEKEAERSRFLSAGTSSIRRKRARGSTKGWFGGGEALNPSLIAHIGPSLTFTIKETVLAA